MCIITISLKLISYDYQLLILCFLTIGGRLMTSILSLVKQGVTNFLSNFFSNFVEKNNNNNEKQIAFVQHSVGLHGFRHER